jgi:hypothetical protein
LTKKERKVCFAKRKGCSNAGTKEVRKVAIYLPFSLKKKLNLIILPFPLFLYGKHSADMKTKSFFFLINSNLSN